MCVTRHDCHLALPKCWEWCLWVPGEGEEGRLSEVGRPWKPAAIAWQGSPLLLRPPGGAAGAAAAPQRCLSLLMLPGGEAALPGGAVVAYHCSCCSCFAAWKSRRLLLERRYGLEGVKGCCRYCCPEEQLILRPQHSCSCPSPLLRLPSGAVPPPGRAARSSDAAGCSGLERLLLPGGASHGCWALRNNGLTRSSPLLLLLLTCCLEEPPVAA